MEGALRRSLGSQTQHTYSLKDHTWSIQQSTTTHTKHIHNIQQQKATTPKRIANCFTKQLTNTVKHATHIINRHINRATYKDITSHSHTSQVQEAIKQRKNNNSQCPDKLNIRHLKHIGPLGLAFLTSMFKIALNKNIIPHTWKLANIVHIPKPPKRHRQGHLIQAHIPPLSNCKDTGEEPSSLHNSKHSKHTHATRDGYITQHSTVTALHTLNNTVAKGFNQMAPLHEQSL